MFTLLFYLISRLPKWGVIYYLKSLWDLKHEITSLHFTDFTIISLCKHHVSLLIKIIQYYNLLLQINLFICFKKYSIYVTL
jgi:hypothetical protein